MENEILVKLQKKNPGLLIQSVESSDFAHFGRIHDDIDAESAIRYARENFIPTNNVAYEPSVPAFELGSGVVKDMIQKVYAGLPAELGWVHGRNTSLGGLEFHKGSEVLAAVTDLVLMLGDFSDISWNPGPAYESSRVKTFFVPCNEVVELYPLVLHFAPLHVRREEGFCALVGLPSLTNTSLDYVPVREGEGVMVYARNTWLMVHPDHPLAEKGAFVGITGENTRLKALDEQ